MRHSIRIAATLIAAPVFVGSVIAGGTSPAVAMQSVSPLQQTAHPLYVVTGFKWDGRQYVAQPGYSLTTPNYGQAVDYAAQFARYPGWCATTNLPPTNAQPIADVPPYILNWLYSMGIQPSQLQARTNAAESDDQSWATFTPTYSDTSDIQNMINTQDMINNQQMLNNIQDMLNTQNMIDTQNMVNNMQDMVNTQNMVNEQNMINSMSNP
jgi:hypothetical protein